jgi:tetratricopeptide (TPR) repeat protein
MLLKSALFRSLKVALRGKSIRQHYTWLSLALIPLLCGCQTFSKRGPISPEVQSCRQYSAQGIAAIEQGNVAEAESLFAKAIESCPTDAEARRRYAEALWKRGDAAAAMGQLEEAARLAPDNTLLAIRMGEIYLSLDRWENAARAADRAVASDHQNVQAWSLRARAMQAGGNHRQALSDWQRALSLDPRNAYLLEELAQAYRRVGQPERALTAVQALIDTFPPGEESARSLHLQGLALAELGRHDMALVSYEQALDRDGPTPDLLCDLGRTALAVQKFERAHHAAAQALELAPHHAAAQSLAQATATAANAAGLAAPLRR